ncbi:hypothetical protein V2J09_016873 [Rumex salicifolius]
MTDFQVGVLIPEIKDLEEDGFVSTLPIFQGENVIGRNDLQVPDKRLSRKHLCLSASLDGSAELTVAGTNPVVVNSKNGRMKLSPKETVLVKDGDVIELIPGQYFFKYLSLVDMKKSPPVNKLAVKNSEHIHIAKEIGKKRIQREFEEEVVINEADSTFKEQHLAIYRSGSSQSKKHIASSTNNYEHTLSHFHVSSEELPSTFRLLNVQGLPRWANTSCVSIADVIQGDVLVAILSNYMVDLDWLLSASPMLKKVPHVLVVHGEGDGTMEYMKMTKPPNFILHKPPLPISYGTHHSKAMLLIYPRGVRVVVHTANLIYVDWNNKTQGLWMQDFPWKGQSNLNEVSEFENDLVDYLSVLKLPEFTANLPTLGSFKINSSFFKKFDYGDAVVRLVGSVPGYHTGPYLRKWGHMKLRSILEKCSFDKQFQHSPLVYQFSSLGSLDEKWMAELKSSMSSGTTDDKTPLGLGEPLIIWPSVEDVRCSLEGYAAGNAVPSPLKNVEKAFLNKYWAKWKASHTGRCQAMPHIKTFVRYSGQNIAWFLLTSANLSKAAWGSLQKNNSQLMIRSYELGVLYLPSLMKKGSGFSCTDYKDIVKDKEQPANSKAQKSKLVTLAWNENESSEANSELVVRLPIPYQLPPPLYTPEDVPWSWDRRYQKKDVHGQVWPRSVKLYSNQDGNNGGFNLS